MAYLPLFRCKGTGINPDLRSLRTGEPAWIDRVFSETAVCGEASAVAGYDPCHVARLPGANRKQIDTHHRSLNCNPSVKRINPNRPVCRGFAAAVPRAVVPEKTLVEQVWEKIEGGSVAALKKRTLARGGIIEKGGRLLGIALLSIAPLTSAQVCD